VLLFSADFGDHLHAPELERDRIVDDLLSGIREFL